MSILLFNEYAEGGRPIWRMAAGHGNIVFFYGNREWGDRPHEHRLESEELDAAIRTFVNPWTKYDFGPGAQGEYALYMPKCEDDFHRLCKYAWRQGDLAVISPEEVSPERLIELTRIKYKETRPIRYLSERIVQYLRDFSWMYLLCLPRGNITCSVFIAQSPDLTYKVGKAGHGMSEYCVIPMEEALTIEQENWEEIYRHFDPN